MGRHQEKMPTRCEMLKARVTHKETGYPASYQEVTECFRHALPAPEDGWWWIPATPSAAERIRIYGHITDGSEFIVWIPQQLGVRVNPYVTPESAHPAHLGFDAETGVPRQEVIVGR